VAGRPMIEVEGVVKHFGDVPALRGIDLSVEAGAVVALIGANGAGNPAPAVRVLLTSVYAPEVPGRLTLV